MNDPYTSARGACIENSERQSASSAACSVSIAMGRCCSSSLWKAGAKSLDPWSGVDSTSERWHGFEHDEEEQYLCDGDATGASHALFGAFGISVSNPEPWYESKIKNLSVESRIKKKSWKSNNAPGIHSQEVIVRSPTAKPTRNTRQLRSGVAGVPIQQSTEEPGEKRESSNARQKTPNAKGAANGVSARGSRQRDPLRRMSQSVGA